MAQGSETVIAVVVQAALHGLYFGTLVHCLRWLMYEDEGWKMRGKINRSMLAVTVLLSLIYTTKLGTSFRSALASVSGDELTYSTLDPAIVCVK